jgi:hypothetical protein
MNGFIMGNFQPSVWHTYERMRDFGAISFRTKMEAWNELPFPYHGWLKITFTEGNYAVPLSCSEG